VVVGAVEGVEHLHLGGGIRLLLPQSLKVVHHEVVSLL
jgi:hypothetical protein